MEEDDQTIVIQEKDKMYSKFCPVCKKGFNSGKAVGGHMRIHIQAKKKVNHQPIKSKKILREDEKISESGYVKKKHHNKKLGCLICGKKFLSMKSLCGHMRCHPERNWRGIQPPKIVKNCSSSKIEPKNIDDQVDSVTDADRNNQTVDTTESFRGFSVTSMRGTSSEDDRLYDAVLDLMMLAHGNSFESGQVVESEATNSNSLTFKSETGDTNKISESKIPSEERGSTNLSNHFIDDAEKGEIGSFLRKSVSVEEHGHEYCERTDTKTTIKNKKRKKRVRLSDLESEKCVDPVTKNPSEHHKYRCITCGKCFETYQALGGHRSSHNKDKNVIYNSIDQSSFAASEDERLSAGIVQVDYESPEIARKCRKILDFDLNEEPPLENEAGIESELAANFDYGSSS